MTTLDYIHSTEPMVGEGHATLPDTLNRALKTLLTLSGLDPDGDFPGFLHSFDWVRPQDYGAVGNGIADDTLAIQTAINTGRPVFFPAGTYCCVGLTQTTNSQKLYGIGRASLIKNGNGAILTSSGDDVQVFGLEFRGEAATPVFTGDNIVLNGQRPQLLHCGSVWAFGHAVRATGARVIIEGQSNIYQTADPTATGWDIYIGNPGTMTLEHRIVGIRTGQSTGGVKFVDCGSQVVADSVFGKLSILDSGATPPGGNGGSTTSCRILNDVIVGWANATFVGNLFGGAVDFEFLSGTTACSLGLTNVWGNGSTVTNSGNVGNHIARFFRDGTVSFVRYGDDVTYTDVRIDTYNDRFEVVGTVQGSAFRVAGTQVVGPQGAPVPNVSGGTTVDVEARATLNTLLARLRSHGLIGI